MNVGERIQTFRKKKGLTQSDLANCVGLSVGTIRHYEQGIRTPNATRTAQIAEALEVTPFDLMGFEYWDMKYPDTAKNAKEIEGFVAYLNSIGYIVRDISYPSKIPISEFEKAGKLEIIPEESRNAEFVNGESHAVEIIQGEKSYILEDEQIADLQKSIKDLISLKLWQASNETK